MLRWTHVLVMTVALSWQVFSSPLASAQISVPNDAKFVLQVDLQALKESRIGGKLLDLAKEAAEKELSENGDGETAGNPMEKVREAIGFDPFSEVQRLVITASDFEHPEKSLLAWLHLKKTTGNIEGLLLSLPNYESNTYGKHEIHSAQPDDTRIYGAIHVDANDDHVLIVSPEKRVLEHQLDLLDRRSQVLDGYKTIDLESDRKTFLSVQVLEFPINDLGEGPHTNIAKRLKSLSFSIAETDADEVDLRLNLETETEKQAAQIRQMIQGLIAMMEFAQSMETNDKDLEQAVQFLKGATTSVDGNRVRMKLSLPIQWVEEALNEENTRPLRQRIEL